jgi:hypothetical protein
MINKKIQTKAQQTKVVHELVDDLRQKLNVFVYYQVEPIENVVRVNCTTKSYGSISDVVLEAIQQVVTIYEQIYPSLVRFHLSVAEVNEKYVPCVDITVERRY